MPSSTTAILPAFQAAFTIYEIASSLDASESIPVVGPLVNPWPALPEDAPLVLAEDQPAVAAFNRGATDRTRIETSLLPEPFVGRLDAPVVFLLLNPGAAEEDAVIHARPAFREAVRRCHRQDACAYPNYYLAPGIEGGGAGGRDACSDRS